MEIIKRDGSFEEYSGNKIINAINKAIKSVYGKDHGYISVATEIEESIERVARNHDKIMQCIEIEEVQDLIERKLMDYESMKDVAKAFIVYRADHTQDRIIESKVNFIEEYKGAENASTGSKFDANANIEKKNVATMTGELHKKENILLNRKLMVDKLCEMYGQDIADEYIRQLNDHEIYKHDETSIKPYCVSISMYPFLKHGMKSLSGKSGAPKHLKSFNGNFINLVFAVASQFAGAVATPEYLMYLDYFIRHDYGDDYHENFSKIVDLSVRQRTIEGVIEDSFQQVVHSLNQPASARDYQSVFWNIGYFDKYYFASMFDGFKFPDGSSPQWESIDWLQRKFMNWFNQERLKCELTFPVETMALLTEDGDVKDKDYADFTSEMYSKGHSFFTYMSDSADSLSSCCRLRNEISNDFSFSLGAGGVASGSKGVITMNVNRLVQDAVNNGIDTSDHIRGQVKKIHKYLTAFNEIMKDNFEARLLPVYDAGYISLEKQYLTIGINGMVESAEFLEIEVSPNDEYEAYVRSILEPIYEENIKAKMNSDELMFNTEFVPAENLGVKHANWDREDGYFVPRDVYNSYFYVVEDDSINILDKFKMHGNEYIDKLDGGSALHANLTEHLSEEQYRQLLKVSAQCGCNYFTFNIPNTVCNECGHIDKRMLDKCPECGSDNLDYLTRVIGYLKRVSSFSLKRQEEERRRYYEHSIR